MPKLHIRLKVGDIEVDVKAEGDIDGATLDAIKYLIYPIASNIFTRRDHPRIRETSRTNISTQAKQSIYSSFKETIMSVFRYGQWFTSGDAKEAYQDLNDIELKQSTVITYLRRMEKEGILLSRRQGRNIKFRLAPYLCETVQVDQNRIVLYDEIT